MNPETAPVKLDESSSFRVPSPPSAKVVFAEEAAPNSSVAVPLIVASPSPVTSPWTVISPSFAHRWPELSTPLSMISPPLPVASSVPELVMMLLPVSMTSALLPVGENRPFVDECHLPGAQLPGARDRVVDVGEHRVGAAAEDHVLVAVGQRDLPAARQRRAANQDLQVGLAARGGELDRAAVLDRPAERHNRAVMKCHRAVLTVTGSTSNAKLAAVSEAASTPSTVIVEPDASVITALPFASLAMVRSQSR